METHKHCTCGFSTEYPICNGTHKVVNKVRKSIVEKIEEIELIETEGPNMTHPRVVKDKAIRAAKGQL